VATDTGWRPLQKPVRGGAAERPPVGSWPFSKLALAHLMSAGGDAMVTLALAGSLFFDISPSAARGRVALSLILTMAPFAVVAPFLGPAIDRLQGGRRYIVVFTALGRSVSCLFMAAGVHSLVLFPAAFFTLVFSKAHFVAKSALVPAVVSSDDELVQANAKLVVGSALMGLVAAIPGVAILKLFNAAAVLRVASIVFFFTAVAAVRIVPSREDRAGPADEDNPALRSRGIVLASGVIGVLRATVGFLTFLLAFDFRRHHAPAYWYGIVLAGSVGGGLLGAVIAPRLRGFVREERIVVGALVVVVVAGIAASVIGGRGAAALMSTVLGLSAGAGKLAFDSLVQRDGQHSAHGRAFAKFESAFQLLWVVGALWPVLLTIGAEAGYVIIAVMTGGAMVAYVVARLRPVAAPA
jgi:hypothetical protein